MASEGYNVYWFVVTCVLQSRKIFNLQQYKVTKFKICPCKLHTHMSPRTSTHCNLNLLSVSVRVQGRINVARGPWHIFSANPPDPPPPNFMNT